VQLAAASRRKRDGVAVAPEIAHDAGRSNLLDKRIPQLLFLTLFRRSSSTRPQRRCAQTNNKQLCPHPPPVEVIGYRGEPRLPAALFSTALAPLRIPNIP